MSRALWIAVDFDGTLCNHEFPEIGKPKLEIIEWVLDMQAKGAKLFLWTCRNTDEERDYLGEAIEWCAEYGIIFDGINQNPFQTFYSRKIVADIYLDDRGLNPEIISVINSYNGGE